MLCNSVTVSSIYTVSYLHSYSYPHPCHSATSSCPVIASCHSYFLFVFLFIIQTLWDFIRRRLPIALISNASIGLILIAIALITTYAVPLRCLSLTDDLISSSTIFSSVPDTSAFSSLTNCSTLSCCSLSSNIRGICASSLSSANLMAS